MLNDSQPLMYYQNGEIPVYSKLEEQSSQEAVGLSLVLLTGHF